MTNKSIESPNKSDFWELIPQYSDDEIIGILKKRKQYQPEAAELAVKEAVKRGLINSEQDLFAEEFNETQSGFQLFPDIKSERARRKTIKSLVRALLIAGAIPTVWGVFQLLENNLIEGGLLFIIGLVWIYTSYQLSNTFNSRKVTVLFIILAASVLYIVKLLTGFKGLKLMDYAVPVILITFIVYGLLFLQKLNK